jgi:acyl-[acyl-carrier-protein]-phospholipid O-acyltransferase/long-chain-fatty-acid--[acyl-carrier-protein] ligase
MINRRTFPVDMNSAYAVKRMAEYLQQGGRLVLFPEGRLSRTGALMKLFDGTGFLIFKTHAKVITAFLRGADQLPFSPNPNLKRWFPRVSAHFSPLLDPPHLGPVSVSQARARLTDWILSQMIEQRFETEMKFGPGTLPEAIRQTARQRPKQVILQDVTMQELSYRRLLVGADLLANQWRALIPNSQQRVGLLVPNVNAFPVVTLSLWQAGKIPAILNYSTGPGVLLACAQLAGLKQIITSKVFFERLKLDPKVFKTAGLELLFLEDVRPRISAGQKFTALLRDFLNLQPSTFNLQPSDTAVVLFTSGSEGNPKGVELTHRNILANIRQMLSVIDLQESDRFFNALPLFHSFGLTVGLLLPLVHRTFVFLYPSPLHYKVVPSAFYNLDCTVLFGTNTFLSGYARKAHPYDFRSLRYLFAGAEKLQESTAAAWMQRFGARVLEGYGATECSPCLSANTPLRPKQGTAGHFLPGIEYRLEPVEGVGEGSLNTNDGQKDQSLSRNAGSAATKVGRLFVRGPNVMKGYLNPEANATFQALGGWYDTGDIVKVDEEGFVHILGRLKRFAKVSGEMVSLAAVEDALAGAFPQFGLKFAVAVLAKPDDEKGEKLIAVTNESKLTREQLRDAVHARGLSNLAVPREIKVVPEIPRLGTGKVNLRELEKILNDK